ncbi:hypothetical protein [Bradyrhizobium sp. CCBAU 051011]|uniref:hypothetical protein n=1 Tax=Bradyrhizobium sp. CCBAU 051011 TaxID=858422 RepID=UPI00137B65AC|nr:hypothetical protein [Bradyrhizobium sp. CCBAU 051011]
MKGIPFDESCGGAGFTAAPEKICGRLAAKKKRVAELAYATLLICSKGKGK